MPSALNQKTIQTLKQNHYGLRQAVRRSCPKGEFHSHPFSFLIQHPSKTDARGLLEPQGMNKGHSLANL